jgi:hypothetical protein
MADYQLTNNDSVIRTTDGAVIMNNIFAPGRMEYEQWLADGNTPDPYVPPAPLTPQIPSLSRRQFFQGLANEGIIPEDDALAALAAVIPAPLLTLVAGLPIEQQFAAKMLLAGAGDFQRTHPLTIAFGSAYGWEPARIDTFFITNAEL